MLRVDIYGLGAIGSNLLVTLAKQHPELQFNGIDFDKVEERNVRTQAYFLEHVGLYKTDAIRVVLNRYLRKPNYQGHRKKITDKDTAFIESGRKQLILDCFDNSESRKVFSNVRGHVLHIGFSPEYSAEIIWNELYDTPDDVDPKRADICSMTEAVSFIQHVTALASGVITKFIQTGEKTSLILTGKNRVRLL